MAIRYDADDENIIKISNDYYEIAFLKNNGGIAYILDKTTKEEISSGNESDALWIAHLYDGETINSNTYERAFHYEWDDKKSSLLLRYSGAIDVEIVVEPTRERTFYMQASLKNNTGKLMEKFSFPHELSVALDSIHDGMAPLLPGALLSKEYFEAGRTFESLYPGAMFADFIGVGGIDSKLSVYGVRADISQPVQIGFRLHPASTQAGIIREFRTRVEKEWSSPKIAVQIGPDYKQAIMGYRADNGFEEYLDLTDKLGEKTEAYFQSPMYKLDIDKWGLTYEQLKKEVVDKIEIPGLLHPVAFQTRGHDQNYPDFIPAASKWGTTESFRNFTNYAQAKGNLVMPYTNFSWWDVTSRYIDGLTAEELQAITVNDSDGQPVVEWYGPHQGYVVNPHHSFVKEAIQEQHDLLMDQIGMDGIFEDQWGARTAPLDFNENHDSSYDESTAYFEGVLEHTRTHKDNLLMTEVGIDVLAEHEVGFMGTNYLWDIGGFRKETAPYSEYYPFIGMLVRDKVLLYQHDLAAETWTDDKAMFRWNLTQGYQFSGEITGPESLENDSWLSLIGVFQKYALSRYAGELVTDFESLSPAVTKTSFETFEVYANWDEEQPFPWREHVVSKGGAALASRDGMTIGGVFDTYNGVKLNHSEHYLLESRSDLDIKVFQAMGWATDLTIKLPDSWHSAKVFAYTYEGKKLGMAESDVQEEQITFKYKPLSEGERVGYYSIVKGR